MKLRLFGTTRYSHEATERNTITLGFVHCESASIVSNGPDKKPPKWTISNKATSKYLKSLFLFK